MSGRPRALMKLCATLVLLNGPVLAAEAFDKSDDRTMAVAALGLASAKVQQSPVRCVAIDAPEKRRVCSIESPGVLIQTVSPRAGQLPTEASATCYDVTEDAGIKACMNAVLSIAFAAHPSWWAQKVSRLVTAAIGSHSYIEGITFRDETRELTVIFSGRLAKFIFHAPP